MSHSSLTDAGGDPVGSMIVLYDVTEERQRGQQLTVLNRRLRYNLRNETNVIGGFADVLQGSVDDAEQAGHAGKIFAASDRLNAIATKVRGFKDVQGWVYQPEAVALEPLVGDLAGRYADTLDAATIEWTVEPATLRARTDPVIL